MTDARGMRISGFLAAVLFVLAHALDVRARRDGWQVLPALSAALTLASIGAGVALLVFGWFLVRARSMRWWRLLAVPAVAIGLFWSVVPLGLAGVACLGKPVHSSVELGAGFKEAIITSSDGTRLVVSYRPGVNGASVVCLPGSGGSTRRAILPHARVLARHGYGVVLVDPRGHGESAGQPMEYGWFGMRDTRAVVDWLIGQPDVNPKRIGILGLSMGGEQALTCAAADDRLAAVVAEGATERSYEDVRRTLRGPSVVLGVPQYRALFGGCELLTVAKPPQPLEEAVKRVAPRPVLLIDTQHEAAYGRRYLQAGGDSVTLWAPASERHIGCLAERPRVWEERVVGFFDAALTPP